MVIFQFKIVSPDYLDSELFSYSGHGTKIVSDYGIEKYEDLLQLDEEQIKSLLEFGFGKNLSKDYFSNLNLEFLLLEEDYDGVAIVEKLRWIFYYLNKLSCES